MTHYFVTRHAGALDWARDQGIVATLIEHLDPALIKAGDTVLGTLPIHLVAALNSIGARYLSRAAQTGADLRRCSVGGHREPRNSCGGLEPSALQQGEALRNKKSRN